MMENIEENLNKLETLLLLKMINEGLYQEYSHLLNLIDHETVLERIKTINRELNEMINRNPGFKYYNIRYEKISDTTKDIYGVC